MQASEADVKLKAVQGKSSLISKADRDAAEQVGSPYSCWGTFTGHCWLFAAILQHSDCEGAMQSAAQGCLSLCSCLSIGGHEDRPSCSIGPFTEWKAGRSSVWQEKCR